MERKRNHPQQKKVHPLPFWDLEEGEREEIVNEMERVLIRKQIGRYASELLRLTLEKRAKFIPWEMRNSDIAHRIGLITSKLYRGFEINYMCPLCLRIVEDLGEHNRIHPQLTMVAKPDQEIAKPRQELTEIEKQKLVKQVEKIALGRIECDHSTTVTLGLKPSFSEGAASELIECRKCGKRIQRNL